MDEILIRKAQKGDKESFTYIIMQAKDQAYRIAFSYLHNEEDSMDAVCNAVEKAFLNINKLKHAEFFSTWFVRIVINECKQIKRKQKRMNPLEDTNKAVCTGSIGAEEKLDLKMMLGKLDSQERMMIYMKYYLGYTLEEIAEIIQIPLGTVKTRIYKNLKAMKSKLEWEEV